MKASRRACMFIAFSALLATSLPGNIATAQGIIVGVNLVNEPFKQTIVEQDATLGALQAAGVHVIRAGTPANNAGIAFAQRAYKHGIKIAWLVQIVYYAQSWLVRPKGYVGIWSNNPGLSHADPDTFRVAFSALLGQLEARGVVLAAFELGNEINRTNGDLAFLGTGKVLSAVDLVNSPEGQRVAQGYLEYLKILAELADIRAHSKLNRQTPVIWAGLADLGQSAKWMRSVNADAVNVDATLNFMRAHGLDQHVDGYGLHFYPPSTDAGIAAGAAMRLAHMRQNGLSQCQALRSGSGKPCWITE